VDVIGEHRQYEARAPLVEDDLDPDPLAQFDRWFADARAAGVEQPEAMTLATCDADGRPHCRYVLLRGRDERGFAFFTGYRSAKAREITANPHVSLTFGWLELHRSVRITGTAEHLPAAESDAYFLSRPRGSRVGAWASPQSSVLADRAELEHRVAEAEARFASGEVPRPDDWGGFLVRPDSLEFWQGRPSRLHDRLRYRREDGAWVVERLAP
jgi:pyridoxamine 5'-phosphate oxidase